jgi:transposase-like protein
VPDRQVLTSQVLAAVDRLPPDLRDLVRRYYLDDQALSSAGRQLGISKTRASIRLSRAIALLREDLDDGATIWPSTTRRPKRRRFSKRFKSDFLRKALEPSANAKKLARDLGVSPSTVWNWTAAARKDAKYPQGRVTRSPSESSS